MDAMHLFKAERRRQVSAEGWTAEHDDMHTDREMLKAAVIYYQHAKGERFQMRPDGAPMGWPWDAEWWKPKDPRRDLVRAGALCLAERDRLIRFSKRTGMGLAPRLAPVNHKLDLIERALNELLVAEAHT